MKCKELVIGNIYALKADAAYRIHREVIKLINIGQRGVITWEDPKSRKRGYINARSITKELL